MVLLKRHGHPGGAKQHKVTKPEEVLHLVVSIFSLEIYKMVR